MAEYGVTVMVSQSVISELAESSRGRTVCFAKTPELPSEGHRAAALSCHCREITGCVKCKGAFLHPGTCWETPESSPGLS